MNPNLIIYSSRTGFTQRFALWLAQALHCEMIELNFLTAEDLDRRETVIFGGHLVGDRVLGYKHLVDNFGQWLPKRVLVFGTGVIKQCDIKGQRIEQRCYDEGRQAVKFFYCQGSPDVKQTPWFYRMMMRRALKGQPMPACPAGKKVIAPILKEMGIRTY